jgi:alkylation response protein AidB-like acyl-CoA dehydrogenase
MDFQLSEQQLAFRDLIREFAHRSIDPVAHEWELSGRYPAEIVDEMRTMGLFGMLVPERYGGIGIDAVSYAIVFEEISKSWMGVAGILGTHSLGNVDAGSSRHRGAAPPVAPRPRHRPPARRTRVDRTLSRQRPSGHHHDRPT